MSITSDSTLDRVVRKYLDDTAPIEWSYNGFLAKMKPLVLMEKIDSAELPAVWRNRFSRGIRTIIAEKENDKDEASRLVQQIGTRLLNQKQIGSTKKYWKQVATERAREDAEIELRNEKSVFELDSQVDALGILKAARRRQTSEIVDELNRGKQALEDPFVVSEAKRKRGINDENEAEVENEVPEETEIKGDEVTEQFEVLYKGLKDEEKWTLRSGNKVEDFIYKYGSTLKHEDLLHSFVLDTDDKKVCNLFSASEWQEILETNVESKGPPKIESDLLCHFARYRKTNVCDLREVVNTPWHKESNYDEEKEFNYTWIDNCFSTLLTLYAIKPHVFQLTHLKQWYDTNIWSSLIDQCT